MIRMMVLYPRTETTTFDGAYWTSTHMPMCKAAWPKCVKWEADLCPDDSGFHGVAHIFFNSMAEMGESMQRPESAGVMGDVQNYYNAAPTVVMNNVAATS
jgi:uncharacterized protein (TIGR02118 family)